MISIPQHSVSLSVVVPVLNVAYVAGKVLSAPFIIPGWSNGVKRASYLQRVRVYDPQNNNVAMTLYLYNKTPSPALVANGVFASLEVAADVPSLVDVVDIPAGTSPSTGAALGATPGAYQLVPLNPPHVIPVIQSGASPIWGVLVANGAVTYAAAGNLTLSFDVTY